jgi:hypothetical protein
MSNQLDPPAVQDVFQRLDEVGTDLSAITSKVVLLGPVMPGTFP